MNQDMSEEKRKMQQAQQQIAQLETAVKTILTKDAWSRYNTLKLAHPDKAVRALVNLAQNAQQHTLISPVTDIAFKQILMRLSTVVGSSSYEALQRR